MAYNIKELAELAGVSARTLRHYNAVGLLRPLRNRDNDYRVYGPREIDLLQQILLYRELGMPLMDIKRLVHSDGYDSGEALESHLVALKARKVQLAVDR
jgi:DNA-binding transcriptional MerR regulator